MECGRAVREAMAAWVAGLGPLASAIAPLTRDGKIRHIGVATRDARLLVAWLLDSDSGDEVVVLPTTEVGVFGPLTVPCYYATDAVPSEKPFWAWQWTHAYLVDRLTELLDARAPLLDTGLLGAEAAWHAAGVVMGKSGVGLQSMSLGQLEARIEGIPEDCAWSTRGRSEKPIAVLLPWIARLKEDGADHMSAPWPIADQRPTGMPACVWDFYSESQLAARIETVYRGALEGYEALCLDLFAPLSRHLNTWLLMPGRIDMLLQLPKSARDCAGIEWYMEPLAKESVSSEVLLRVGALGRPSREELFDSLQRKVDLLRPEVAHRVNITHHSQIVSIFGDRPATDVCYGWLFDDLKRIGWVKGSYVRE